MKIDANILKLYDKTAHFSKKERTTNAFSKQQQQTAPTP
jgi:hypothetical protein